MKKRPRRADKKGLVIGINVIQKTSSSKKRTLPGIVASMRCATAARLLPALHMITLLHGWLVMARSVSRKASS
jgi:hypothetical protein